MPGLIPVNCGGGDASAVHLTHLLDEAPVQLVVKAVEEAGANEGVAPEAVWLNVEELARSPTVHRQRRWV